jgi:hypothetical protein
VTRLSLLELQVLVGLDDGKTLPQISRERVEVLEAAINLHIVRGHDQHCELSQVLDPTTAVS